MSTLPSSRSAFSIRLSLFDSAWAVFSPLLALYLRDAPALSYDGLIPTLLYCSLSVAFSLIAFSAFRIKAGMTRYFSVLDSIDVTKAVVVAALTTYVVVFSLTRLDGIPRTTPIIHALILLAGTRWDQDFNAPARSQEDLTPATQGYCRRAYPDDRIKPPLPVVHQVHKSLLARFTPHHGGVG